jgi:hypothetical protein
MSEREYTDLRIGDAEREAAVGALGDHLSAGRLTIDEYGDRMARATAARTHGELLQLFADLPAPRPAPAVDLRKDTTSPSQVPLASAAPAALPVPANRLAPRIFRGLGWISGVAWFILLVTGHGQFWWLLFVPAIFYVFASQVWPSEKDERRRRRCSGAARDEDARHRELT